MLDVIRRHAGGAAPAEYPVRKLYLLPVQLSYNRAVSYVFQGST